MERLWAVDLGGFRAETKFPHCWWNKDLRDQAEGSQRRRRSMCWYCGSLRRAFLCLPFTGKPGGEAEEDTTGSSQDLDMIVEGTYAWFLSSAWDGGKEMWLKLYQDREALDMQAECSRLARQETTKWSPKKDRSSWKQASHEGVLG